MQKLKYSSIPHNPINLINPGSDNSPDLIEKALRKLVGQALRLEQHRGQGYQIKMTEVNEIDVTNAGLDSLFVSPPNDR